MQRGPQRPGKLKGSRTNRVAVFSQLLAVLLWDKTSQNVACRRHLFVLLTGMQRRQSDNVLQAGLRSGLCASSSSLDQQPYLANGRLAGGQAQL